MTIYQYDINSAYAAVYKTLPCLSHGKWVKVTEQPKDGIYVGTVAFEHRRSAWYTFPVRTKLGNIIFPRTGNGTYWSPELHYAAGRSTSIVWKTGFKYEPDCHCTQFTWVEPLFHERKRLGKDAKGRVLKTLLASIYGKLAQSIGSAPYANPIWAGLILSTVRTQLLAAAQSDSSGHGYDVHMLATDGLFCSEKRTNLDIGPELGQWSVTEHSEMFVVQSGVYFLPDSKPKTRGTPRKKITQHIWDFYSAWNQYLETGVLKTIRIELRNFIGLRLAHARGKPDIAGQWFDVTRDIAFDWTTKRTNPQQHGTYVTTDPPEGSAQLHSIPYSRSIGALLRKEKEVFEGQPDWADEL